MAAECSGGRHAQDGCHQAAQVPTSFLLTARRNVSCPTTVHTELAGGAAAAGGGAAATAASPSFAGCCSAGRELPGGGLGVMLAAQTSQ